MSYDCVAMRQLVVQIMKSLFLFVIKHDYALPSPPLPLSNLFI